MKTDCVYEIALSNLGIEQLETPEQFADLYEYVANNYDLFNEEHDKWPEWFAELSELYEKRRDMVGFHLWMESKLKQRENVASLAACAMSEGFHITWQDCRAACAGGSGSRLNDLLPDMDDWLRFQRFLEDNDWEPTYGQVRRFLGLSGNQSPNGHAIVNLVQRFGGRCMTRDGLEMPARPRQGV